MSSTKRQKKLPRMLWYHHNKGEVYWEHVFFSEKAAKDGLKELTSDKNGNDATLYSQGWRVVGPYIRNP